MTFTDNNTTNVNSPPNGNHVMLRAALEWGKQYPVFPLIPGDKKPITEHGKNDAAQIISRINEYWNKYPKANIGIVTIGLLVLDFDEHQDKETYGLSQDKPAFIARYGELPKTRVHKTGGGGEHWLYSIPTDSGIGNSAKVGGFAGIEIKAGKNGTITVPPSKTTGEYQVIDDSPIAPAPEWLIELSKARAPRNTTTQTEKGAIIPNHQRNSTLASFAGTFRTRGMNQESITAALLAINANQCDPPLLENDVIKIAASYGRYPAGEIIGTNNPESFKLTDAGNGEAIAAEWKAVIRYVFEWKSWLIYDGKVWRRDTNFNIRNLAIKTMRELCAAAVNIEDKDKRKKATEWYFSSESDRRINSALNFAMAQTGITINAGELDNQPWLLNVANGTIDLQTCEIREHKASDLLTQIININYNPEATAPEWEKFLQTIFNNNTELITYIRRAMGYTINGTQLERIMFFLFGMGKNGKSQLMAACRKVLGPYADEAKPDLFMEKRFASSGPDEGQAALRGIRLLTATETKRGQALDTSLIKRMTGGEPIWCERKFQSGFSVMPTHTLWLSGNHEPKIKDSTDSIWDRINKIPFECRISAENEIKGYGDLLAEKYPEAILNFMVTGAREYKEQGLNPPDIVKLANQEYRESQDLLHDFLQHVKRDTGNITVLDMYKYYESVCKADEVELIGKKAFNEAMRERGYKDKRGAGNKLVWAGVTFLDEISYGVTNVTEKQESFVTTRAREETFQNLDNKSNFEAKTQKISNFNNLSNPENQEILELPED